MKKVVLFLLAFAAFQMTGFSQKKGDKVEVLWNSKWYPASVIDVPSSTTWKIHYTDYSDSFDEVVGKDRIRLVWKKGDVIQVKSSSTWYKATILEVNGSKYKIHYDGWSDSWDEWVTTDRMKK